MSSVLAEFLQQFFTLIFTSGAVVLLGGNSPGCFAIRNPSLFIQRGRLAGGAAHYASRADKLADIQNTCTKHTGNRIVKAFSMETWR